MSQLFRSSQSSPPPPVVATSYVTDDGTAVPAANILIVHGTNSAEDDPIGIIAKGGVVGTGVANQVDIVLTNRLQGTSSTVGATTADVISFPLSVVGNYQFKLNVVAYNTTSSLGAAYDIMGGVRFNGVTAVLNNNPITNDDEEGAMSSCDLDIVVSGASAILRVTGYAAQTINWGAVGYYVFVGA